MKHLLKAKFDPIYWANSFDLRRSDVSKKMPMISLKSQWPSLFKLEGVIILIKKIYFIFHSAQTRL